MTPVEVLEKVIGDIGSLQMLVEQGYEDAPRGGWSDLEALLRLTRLEAARALVSEGSRIEASA